MKRKKSRNNQNYTPKQSQGNIEVTSVTNQEISEKIKEKAEITMSKNISQEIPKIWSEYQETESSTNKEESTYQDFSSIFGTSSSITDTVKSNTSTNVIPTATKNKVIKNPQINHNTERRDTMRPRISSIQRKTSETDIKMELGIDGNGISQIDTGIGFFDHMLNSFARHGLFDLKLAVQGDLIVDSHHTVEDTGIVLGQAIKEAVGNKAGIKRYGSVILPMDEALVLCAIDLSGRPYLVYNAEFTADRVGYLDTEMVKEFFYAISYSAGMNLHIKVLEGSNNHHIIEAIFKAFAKALDEAVSLDHRFTDVLSTKGAL